MNGDGPELINEYCNVHVSYKTNTCRSLLKWLKIKDKNFRTTFSVQDHRQHRLYVLYVPTWVPDLWTQGLDLDGGWLTSGN